MEKRKYLDYEGLRGFVNKIKELLSQKTDADKLALVKRKKEIRYVPFKAIRPWSVKDGKYINRYVYNNPKRIPLYIPRRVRAFSVTINGKMCNDIFADMWNRRTGRNEILVNNDGKITRQGDVRGEMYVNIDVSDLPSHGEYTCYFEVSNVSEYKNDNEELVLSIDIEACAITDGIIFASPYYKLSGGKIVYTNSLYIKESMTYDDFKENILTPRVYWRNRKIICCFLRNRRRLRHGEYKTEKQGYYKGRKKHKSRRSKIIKVDVGVSYWSILGVLKKDRYRHSSSLGFEEYVVCSYYNRSGKTSMVNIKKSRSITLKPPSI